MAEPCLLTCLWRGWGFHMGVVRRAGPCQLDPSASLRTKLCFTVYCKQDLLADPRPARPGVCPCPEIKASEAGSEFRLPGARQATPDCVFKSPRGDLRGRSLAEQGVLLYLKMRRTWRFSFLFCKLLLDVLRQKPPSQS